MYINHITLSTGHNARIERADVADGVLSVVAPWLDKAVCSERFHPLPVPALSHYSAKAYTESGGLIVTLYGPAGPHVIGKPSTADIPLVTFGVAQRSRHGEALWEKMLSGFEHRNGIQQPATPWLAVVVHPSIVAHFSVLDWVADFEKCCAWSWITRNPQLGKIK